MRFVFSSSMENKQDDDDERRDAPTASYCRGAVLFPVATLNRLQLQPFSHPRRSFASFPLLAPEFFPPSPSPGFQRVRILRSVLSVTIYTPRRPLSESLASADCAAQGYAAARGGKTRWHHSIFAGSGGRLVRTVNRMQRKVIW